MMRWMLLVLLGTMACAGSDDDHDHDHDHDHGEEMNLTSAAVTDGGTWTLSYAADPAPITMSENFSLTVTVDDGPMENIELAWDAEMPAHNHGMNTAAEVIDNEDGTFTVNGMLFHMGGHWRMMGDVTNGEVTETAVFDVEL